MILFVLSAIGATLIAPWVLDRAIAWTLHLLAPILPNDVAGPDGLFVDTRHGKGVFDRRA